MQGPCGQGDGCKPNAHRKPSHPLRSLPPSQPYCQQPHRYSQEFPIDNAQYMTMSNGTQSQVYLGTDWNGFTTALKIALPPLNQGFFGPSTNLPADYKFKQAPGGASFTVSVCEIWSKQSITVAQAPLYKPWRLLARPVLTAPETVHGRSTLG